LSQLIGGKHFTAPCTLAYNGYGVQTSALVDSGANGLIFIDTQFATELAQFLDAKISTLTTPCPVKGFDGKPGKSATHVITLNLDIDRHRQQKIPMLILDLGSHNLILGRKWLAYHDIWLDVRNRRLLWPDQSQENYPRIREICTTRERLQPRPVDTQHQADVVQRDQAFQQEEAQWTPRILKRPKKAVVPNQTFAREYQENLSKMERELKGIPPTT
jgi:hypothetical protein